MTEHPALHIVFTLDCDAVALKRVSRDVPRSWEQSARAIEGYCGRLLSAGFPPTLFVSHEAAVEHAPMLEELVVRGAEVGLLVNPPQMELGRFNRNLGEYSPEDQRLIVDYAAEHFADALGSRPRSVRTGKFSASDATFKVLYDLGFRQGSISRPGWQVARFASRWAGADHNPRYTSAADRLTAGDLPFFELPLSTDPSRRFMDGMPLELTVDAGAVDVVHRPVIETRLAQMQAEGTRFRALCATSSSRLDYYDSANAHSGTLEALIDEISALADRYELIPTTLSGAHERFRVFSRHHGEAVRA